MTITNLNKQDGNAEMQLTIDFHPSGLLKQFFQTPYPHPRASQAVQSGMETQYVTFLLIPSDLSQKIAPIPLLEHLSAM